MKTVGGHGKRIWPSFRDVGWLSAHGLLAAAVAEFGDLPGELGGVGASGVEPVVQVGLEPVQQAAPGAGPAQQLAAGVDPRTVGGRLGHAGGGTTTLRVYTAWVAESDQRAAATLSARMPARSPEAFDRVEYAKTEPRTAPERIAVAIRKQILDGTLAPGSPAPTQKELAVEHHVSADPAHLSRLLTNAARRHGGTDVDLSDYELEVRRAGEESLLTSFAVL